MAKKTLTLIVVPDHDAPVRRFQLEKSLIRHAALGAAVVGAVVLAAVIHYFALVREASENRLLRDENLTLRTQLKSIRERMEHIGATLERVERFDQKSRLASTPSVWPARGWVTSDFGQRLDPYTAERVMHEGLDIAAPHGKEVVAPSDGVIIFAGLEGGYGNVLVIDHGYGVKTRYGHLSKLEVKTGDHVKRGQVVGAVGNTGRSTGPHLHYEVRVNGIPENPRKFILEE